MPKNKIKDYWCFGCGLVCDNSFVCPICGSISYGIIDLDLSQDPNKEQVMALYENGNLYVHHEDGKLIVRAGSVGPVEKALIEE